MNQVFPGVLGDSNIFSTSPNLCVLPMSNSTKLFPLCQSLVVNDFPLSLKLLRSTTFEATPSVAVTSPILPLNPSLPAMARFHFFIKGSFNWYVAVFLMFSSSGGVLLCLFWCSCRTKCKLEFRCHFFVKVLVSDLKFTSFNALSLAWHSPEKKKEIIGTHPCDGWL